MRDEYCDDEYNTEPQSPVAQALDEVVEASEVLTEAVDRALDVEDGPKTEVADAAVALTEAATAVQEAVTKARAALDALTVEDVPPSTPPETPPVEPPTPTPETPPVGPEPVPVPLTELPPLVVNRPSEKV